MPELRVTDGVLTLALEDAPDAGLEMSSLVRALTADGRAIDIPIEHVERTTDELILRGRAGDFSAAARWRVAGRVTSYQTVSLKVRYDGSSPREVGLRVIATVLGAKTPRWLIPGLFYGENRRADNRVVYPRWDPDGGDVGECTSDSWSFRADRAALPAVLCWRDRACVALWGSEWGGESDGMGEHGLGFLGAADGSVQVWLDMPAREEPVSYVDHGTCAPTSVAYQRWQPGESRTVRFAAYVAAPDPHAYDALLREAYWQLAETNPLHPWIPPAEAADLCAYGLMRWHYRPEHRVLIETAAFDRAQAEQRDRPNMHVAWVSGAPWAAALLEHGRRRGSADETEAAVAVLDKIAEGLAPCGCFWGEWRLDGGWSAGWNEGGTLHARTIAEATLFMLRALAAEERHGVAHPTWIAAVRSNLEFAVARQRADGTFGSYYDAQTGEVASWEGAAGLGWVAALAAGATHFNEPAWLDAARRGGAYYARFVQDELIYGAPEDVHLTPTSEDGYQAVIAYMELYAAGADQRWLALAARAADWMLTFRYAYNVHFDPSTMLGQYDFRTRGADQASPANQHLHAYGLICLPEMLALWRARADEYYLERTRDNLACFLQFVARSDGDFGAQKGMVSERFFQTEWGAPKGSLLDLSHAWSIGVLLHASLAAVDDAEAFPAAWPRELATR